jgi:hypothetical protein
MLNKPKRSSFFPPPSNSCSDSITQAIRCWFPTAEPRIQFHVTSCETRGGPSNTGTGFLMSCFGFPHSTFAPWGVRQPWPCSTLSLPPYLSWGFISDSALAKCRLRSSFGSEVGVCAICFRPSGADVCFKAALQHSARSFGTLVYKLSVCNNGQRLSRQAVKDCTESESSLHCIVTGFSV